MIYDIKIIGAIDDAAFDNFITALSDYSTDCSRPLIILLNSFGGEAVTAVAIIEAMRLSGHKFNIFAIGQVQSAAVLILAAGDNRKMARECSVMVHEDSGRIKGSVTDMEKSLASLRAAEDQWNRLLASKTEASAMYWASLHQETTYLTADECLELGLIDEVV